MEQADHGLNLWNYLFLLYIVLVKSLFTGMKKLSKAVGLQWDGDFEQHFKGLYYNKEVLKEEDSE